jgi:hypothetical protein
VISRPQIIISIGEKLYTKYNAFSYIYSIPPDAAEIRTPREVDQKFVGSFEMWCRRRLGKTISADRVRNEEASHTARAEEKNLHAIKTRTGN